MSRIIITPDNKRAFRRQTISLGAHDRHRYELVHGSRREDCFYLKQNCFFNPKKWEVVIEIPFWYACLDEILISPIYFSLQFKKIPTLKVFAYIYKDAYFLKGHIRDWFYSAPVESSLVHNLNERLTLIRIEASSEHEGGYMRFGDVELYKYI